MFKNFSVLLIILVLVGCATSGAPVTGKPVVTQLGVYVRPIDYVDQPQVIYPDGRALLLRYDVSQVGVKEALVARDIDAGTEQTIKQDEWAKNSFLIPFVVGKDAYVAWRPKLNVRVDGVGQPGLKMIKMAASHDGGKTFSEGVRISSADGAFDPAIAANTRGDVYALWQDERNGTPYELYRNVSHDGGKTWKAQDVKHSLAPAQKSSSKDPLLLAMEDEVFAGWVEADSKAQNLYLQRSGDRGENWDAPVLVASDTKVSMDRSRLLVLKDKWCYYWTTTDALQHTCSTDRGAHWAEVTKLPDTVNVLERRIERDASGRVHMVYGQKRTDDAMEDLLYVHSDDGIHFSTPLRLNTTQAGKSTAQLVDIAIRADGTVMAVWEDRRNFRTAIRGNISHDRGNTWLAQDFAVSERQGVDFAIFPKLSAHGDRFDVVWMQYTDHLLMKGKSALRTFTALDDLRRVSEAPAPESERLKSRIREFWQLRIDKQLGKAYDYLDPFYRTFTTREQFIANTVGINYYAMDLVEFKVDGTAAKVKTRINFEMPRLAVGGKIASIPRKDQDLDTEWIWVDGDWHNVVVDVFNKSLVPY